MTEPYRFPIDLEHQETDHCDGIFRPLVSVDEWICRVCGKRVTNEQVAEAKRKWEMEPEA